jgi:glycerol dehydrogenase-like iron-containing ADH family enzyme
MGAVGGATTWQTLGLEKHRVLEALQVSHYLRERFTVFKLLKLLGMPTQSADEGLG